MLVCSGKIVDTIDFIRSYVSAVWQESLTLQQFTISLYEDEVALIIIMAFA